MTQNGLWESATKKLSTMTFRGHFRFTTLSGGLLFLSLIVALGVRYISGTDMSAVETTVLAAAAAGAAVILLILPFWPVVILTIAFAWVFIFAFTGTGHLVAMMPAAAVIAAGILVAPTLQIANHWQKAVVLRFGRFNRVFGPGPSFILPVADSIVRFVDMRIRVTDFSAEQSITRDTVPVHVDALTFWMVWDAEKAILEVENYVDAVTLSAQTALRDSIGRNDLATLLSERERLGSEIQATLDAKTNPWGITILSIEFKEVLVPKELEDALSKQAQAERERKSRIILGSAEVEIARKFEEAAATYEKNPTAFQLRAMNMVYDSIRTNKNIVLFPSSALDSMNLGTGLGAGALVRNLHAADIGSTDDAATKDGE
ncbi:MAG TPA: slipin family protein [Spirochaetia bacterium]|nr:slipin family protein [Spirochaetia bacterium]